MRFALAALLAFLSPLSAAALTVTLNSAGHASSVLVRAADNGLSASTLFPTSLPFVQSQTVSVGRSTSTVDVALTAAAFDLLFEQTVGTYGGEASSGGSHLYFTVDEDAQYVLSGFYTATNPIGYLVAQEAHLFDETTGRYLFLGSQYSSMTPNESFTLGLQEGDHGNQIQGSLTGALTAGHVYQFFHINRLTSLNELGAALAVGSLTLALVPEPTSGALLALGLTGLALYGTRPHHTGSGATREHEAEALRSPG